MRNWLENIEVGQPVIVKGQWHKLIDKVQRLTKTQIILEQTYTRYRRSDGKAIGASSSFHPNICEATIEEIQKIQHSFARKNMINQIKKCNLNSMDDAKLVKIFKLVDEGVSGEKN